MHPTLPATPDNRSEKELAPLMARAESVQSSASDREGSDQESVDTVDTSPTPQEDLFPCNAADTPSEATEESAKPTVPSPTPVAPPVSPGNHRLPISELFKPKIKLLMMLLEIDFFAGCIIISNTVLSGGINSIKTANQTQLAAAVMEIILAKTIDTKGIFIILLQHVLLQLLFQSLLAFSVYAYGRSRRPLRKALHIQLMQSYTCLPYDVMVDKHTREQFRMVLSTPTR